MYLLISELLVAMQWWKEWSWSCFNL